MKQLLALLLTMVMVIAIMVFPAFAVDVSDGPEGSESLNQKPASFYHWQIGENEAKSITVDGATQNNWLLTSASIQNGILTRAIFQTEIPIVLYHNRPWVIQWWIDGEDFLQKNGHWFVIFDDLYASQMCDTIYITMYKGDIPASNTMSYSIESYIAAKWNDEDPYLSALVKAMLRYGDSARKYVLG